VHVPITGPRRNGSKEALSAETIAEVDGREANRQDATTDEGCGLKADRRVEATHEVGSEADCCVEATGEVAGHEAALRSTALGRRASPVAAARRLHGRRVRDALAS
jgi:hypothetical protein